MAIGNPTHSIDSASTIARLVLRFLVWPAAALAVIGAPAWAWPVGSPMPASAALLVALMLAAAAALPARFRPFAALAETLAAGLVAALTGGVQSIWILLFPWLLLDHGTRRHWRVVPYVSIPPTYLAVAWWAEGDMPEARLLAVHLVAFAITGLYAAFFPGTRQPGVEKPDGNHGDDAGVIRLQERVLSLFGSLAEGDEGVGVSGTDPVDSSRGARVLARALHALLSRQPGDTEPELRFRGFDPGVLLESTCSDWAACARSRNLDLQGFVTLEPGSRAFGDRDRITRILDLLLLAGCFSANSGVVRLEVATAAGNARERRLELILTVAGERDPEFVAWRVKSALEARARELGGTCLAEGTPAEGEWRVSLPADLESGAEPDRRRLSGVNVHIAGASVIRPVMQKYLEEAGATLAGEPGEARIVLLAEPARDPGTEAQCQAIKQAHPRLSLLCQGSTIGLPASLLMEADAVIPVPFSRDELVRLVNQHLGARKANGTRHRPARPTPEEESGPEQVSGGVLVAEDDAISARVVTSFLEAEGWRVQRVQDGEAALEGLKSGGPHLALLDMHMPGLGGVEVAERFRAWEREQGRIPIPLVALTASSADEDRRACRDAGMDDFLSKPVDREALRALLERFSELRTKA